MTAKFSKAVLLTGLFVGTTDILYAFISIDITSGHFPDRMFQYIAGGAVGLDRALKGGIAMGLLGLFIHYLIAMSFTFLFFYVYPKWRFLAYNKYLVGMLYGLLVNLLMNEVVLPLTPLPPSAFDLARAFVDWIIFGFIFGVPIAFNAYRWHGEG